MLLALVACPAAWANHNKPRIYTGVMAFQEVSTGFKPDVTTYSASHKFNMRLTLGTRLDPQRSRSARSRRTTWLLDGSGPAAFETAIDEVICGTVDSSGPTGCDGAHTRDERRVRMSGSATLAFGGAKGDGRSDPIELRVSHAGGRGMRYSIDLAALNGPNDGFRNEVVPTGIPVTNEVTEDHYSVCTDSSLILFEHETYTYDRHESTIPDLPPDCDHGGTSTSSGSVIPLHLWPARGWWRGAYGRFFPELCPGDFEFAVCGRVGKGGTIRGRTVVRWFRRGCPFDPIPAGGTSINNHGDVMDQLNLYMCGHDRWRRALLISWSLDPTPAP